MKRISYKTAKLAAEVGYNKHNKVYYYLDQNNNPKIECVLPDNPAIQNSEFEDIYTAPYVYELVEWLIEKHNIFISMFPITCNQLSAITYKIINTEVVKISEESYILANPSTDYDYFLNFVLQKILMIICYDSKTAKNTL